MKAGDEIIHVIKGELSMGYMKQLWMDEQERLLEYGDGGDAEYYEYIGKEYDRMKASELQMDTLIDLTEKEKNPYVAFDKLSEALETVRTKLKEAMDHEPKEERDRLIQFQRYVLKQIAELVKDFGNVASTGYDANVVLRGAPLSPEMQAQVDKDLEEVTKVFSKEPF